MSSNADSIALRKKEFFTEHCIELQTGKEVIFFLLTLKCCSFETEFSVDVKNALKL